MIQLIAAPGVLGYRIEMVSVVRLIFGTFLVVLAVFTALVAVGQQAGGSVSAAGVIRYVATSGVDAGACDSQTNPCRTLLYAGFAAQTGDEIRVAGGSYSSLGTDPTLWIQRSLSVVGGYTLTNWTNPDPVAHPVTITQAGPFGQRSVKVENASQVSIQGVRITTGGLEAFAPATLVISNVMFINNRHLRGGAMVLYGAQATVTGSRFENNLAKDTPEAKGGAISVQGGAVLTVTGSIFSGNVAGDPVTPVSPAVAAYGGAIEIDSSTARVLGSSFLGNRAAASPASSPGPIGPPNGAPGIPGGFAEGGAVFAIAGVFTSTGNVFDNNQAAGGSGSGGGATTGSLGTGGTGGQGGDAYGGAVKSLGSTIALVDSLYRGNSALGGNGGAGGQALVDPSNAGAGGGGGVGQGGAIYLAGGEAVIKGGEAISNTAKGGHGGTGGTGGVAAGGAGGVSGQSAGGVFGTEGVSAKVAISGLIARDNRSIRSSGGAGGPGLPPGPAGNEPPSRGGALRFNLDFPPAGTLFDVTNVVLVGNTADRGAAINSGGVATEFRHLTMSSNVGGEAVLLSGFNAGVAVTITNAIIVSSTAGIVTEGPGLGRGTVNGVLWFSVPITVQDVSSTVTVANQYTGDPRFAQDGYHLQSGSMAINRGVPTSLSSDIDGQPRVAGPAPDLGADETVGVSGLTVTGPLTGTVGLGQPFVALAQPATATKPIQYLWSATGLPSFTTSAGVTSTGVFSWPTTGVKQVQVVAFGTTGQTTATATIQIVDPALQAPGGFDQVGRLSGYVFALARGGGGPAVARTSLASEPAIYAGGAFTEAGGQSVSHIALLDPITLGWNSVAGGTDGPVYALASSGQTLYAGGAFSQAGGQGATFVAQFNSATGWNSVSGGTNGPVNALVVNGQTLYAGGTFSQAGGAAASNVAQFSQQTGWLSMSSGMDGPVLALASQGGQTYAGGQFTQAGGGAANNIASWNGAGWNSLNGGGTNGPVYAVAMSGTMLYVGGAFSAAGGVPAANFAVYDTTTGTWSAVGAGTNGAVQAIDVNDGAVFIGGQFTQAGGLPVGYVARVDGTVFTPLGAGTNDSVFAIEGAGSAVFLGGAFTAAGGLPAGFITRFGAERVIRPAILVSRVCVQCQPGW